MMPTVACPFCFHRIDTSRLAYQCSNRGTQRCTLAVDPERQKLTGSQIETYHTFTTENGGESSATCPKCKATASRRACPTCHTAVPIDFVSSNSPMLGIVGSKGSGKTVLMTVLVKHLREVVGKQFQAAIRIATDNPDGIAGVEAYKANREAALFADGTLPPKTNQQDVERRAPLVMLWQQERTRRFGGSGVQSTVFSFVDTAGEDLTTLDTTFTLQYLSACDGLLVSLDPFALPGARSRLTLPESALQSSDGTPLEVIARITELLKVELGVKRKKKINLPVAVVFTKIDAFYSTLSQDNPIMTAPARLPAYQENDGQAVHEHMKALLYEWNAGEVDLHMSLNYSRFRYFGVSALGAEPDYAKLRVESGGVHPHRVEDPMLWLLSRTGAVPST